MFAPWVMKLPCAFQGCRGYPLALPGQSRTSPPEPGSTSLGHRMSCIRLPFALLSLIGVSLQLADPPALVTCTLWFVHHLETQGGVCSLPPLMTDCARSSGPPYRHFNSDVDSAYSWFLVRLLSYLTDGKKCIC